MSIFQVPNLPKIQSSESPKLPKTTILDHLNYPNWSGGKMFKLQYSKAWTSHFESFWSIVRRLDLSKWPFLRLLRSRRILKCFNWSQNGWKISIHRNFHTSQSEKMKHLSLNKFHEILAKSEWVIVISTVTIFLSLITLHKSCQSLAVRKLRRRNKWEKSWETPKQSSPKVTVLPLVAIFSARYT